MALNYHTYKEIRQQPRVWKEAYKIVLSRKEEIKSFVDKYLAEGYEIVLAGAGTSAYIGDALEPALHKTRFKGAHALATTDIITYPDHYFDPTSKVLLISFARSGNSPESVGAVKTVEKYAGSVAHIFITCNENGELARMKGDNILTVLLPPETNDLSLAMTSSYSTMYLVCSLIANIHNIENQEESIDILSECVRKAMDRYEDDIRKMASMDISRAVFLGSGTLRGVAEESSLKLQELTDGQIMCAHDTFLGFRHGPKALVNSKALLIYLLSPESRVQPYELDLIRQIKGGCGAKGYILVCRKAPESLDSSYWDLCVETGLPEGFPGYYGGVAYVFVAQMLGLFKSIAYGLNPDSPSVSGNISRVVEGVKLYI
ncbi:MAG: SIS domain-containing protein [Bacteroidales bacterium]|nr:SIS domain-containing protein [Bacteroidales bacterium]